MNNLNRLLGTGANVQCRVISEDISVHWWRSDDSGLCLCGAKQSRYDKGGNLPRAVVDETNTTGEDEQVIWP